LQLFALNSEQELILASRAERQHDYTCPECHSRVRVRAGSYRTPHFFHLDENRNCRQNGKSLQHLQTQYRLQQMLPETKLERSFPSISRIADVAWEKEKIVFEVQCSPITAEELRSRNRDYKSVGWTPIWIFHEDRYNKRLVTAAEWAVRRDAHYFTDIDEDGLGNFYTHLSDIQRGRRTGIILRNETTFETPFKTKEKLHFSGDGWEQIFDKPKPKRNFRDLVKFLGKELLRRIRVFFVAIFYHFFEKACR
jgi:competence protein CoiA